MWMKTNFYEGNQIHNFMSSSGSGTVINYGSGSDFLPSYGSGSTSQKVTVPTVLIPVPVPVPQHCFVSGSTTLKWRKEYFSTTLKSITENFMSSYVL